MRYYFLIFTAALTLNVGTANAQLQIQPTKSNNADLKTLEGVTLKNGSSSMLIVSNANIKKTTNFSNIIAANTIIAPTFLQKIGPYEIHRNPARLEALDINSAKPNFAVNGKAVPIFAEVGKGQEFIGAAYLMDTKQMGLISREVVVKFKTTTIPPRYAVMEGKELVPRSGLYIFSLSDIYAWIKFVSSLQADPQIAFVEPHIKTEFAKAQ